MTPADFRAYRLRLGMTRPELAQALEMSVVWVKFAESGRLRLKRIHALALEALLQRRSEGATEAAASSVDSDTRED